MLPPGATPRSAFNPYLFLFLLCFLHRQPACLFKGSSADCAISQVFICFLHGPLPLPLCKGYNSFVLFPSSRLVDYQRHGRLPPPHIFASCHSHKHIERRESPRAPRICFLPAAAALCRPRQINSGAAISVPCLTPPFPDTTTTTGSRGLMTKEAGDGGRLRHVRRPPRSLLQHTRPRAHPELSPS